MNAVVSVCLLACALGIIVYLLSRRENSRRSQYGPAGLSEFRSPGLQLVLPGIPAAQATALAAVLMEGNV